MPNNIMTRSTNTINSGDDIQSFAPDPVKCLGTKTAGTVFMAGPGGNVNIAEWLGICLYPTADGQIVFNGDTTNTQIMPIFAGRDNVIIIHPNVTQIVASVDAIICGM
jgi:hypothetical protein